MPNVRGAHDSVTLHMQIWDKWRNEWKSLNRIQIAMEVVAQRNKIIQDQLGARTTNKISFRFQNR